MRMTIFGVAAFVFIATGGNANACLPPPEGYVPPKPKQSVTDQSARHLFGEATYIAQVIVLERPRDGRLRVIAMIKGQAPETILVPLPDPCRFHFQVPGESLFVILTREKTQPFPLPNSIVASLRRQRLGNWANVR